MDKIQVEKETKIHINRVGYFLLEIQKMLFERAKEHDKSKLSKEELPVFVEFTPKLKDSTYGSDEYRSYLKAMKPALDHHYAANRHHPEHFPAGIIAMNLIDIIEMFCDWRAATERHADGNMFKSIELNRERFNYSDELCQIFTNTALLFDGDKPNG